MFVRVGLVLLLVTNFLFGQVSLITGSHSTATASGSGASGVPSLSYTPYAGSSRLLVFYMVIERDHLPGSRGDNWASDAALGGSVPTVQLGAQSLIHLSSQWIYEYNTTNATSDAEISLELMIYGILESDIPGGLNSISITGNFNNPSSAGDEAVFGIVMFENVDGMSHIVNSNCSSCNTISTSAVSPNDVNNMVFSIVGASSDRVISAGAGQTIIGSTNVSNASGTYSEVAFSEEDGLSAGLQYRTGQTTTTTNNFSASGSANMFGMLESAFRITSPTLLPVEFMEFACYQKESENRLYWVTASEFNNSHFNVEKSLDGFNWGVIGTIDGSGNSSSFIEYEFYDTNVDADLIYYRIKQVDYDGEFSYTSTISVKGSEKEKPIIIYNEQFKDLLINSKKGIQMVDVYNINGQLIRRDEVSQTEVHRVHLHDLPSGHYIVNVETDKEIFTEKFVVK